MEEDRASSFCTGRVSFSLTWGSSVQLDQRAPSSCHLSVCFPWQNHGGGDT